MSFNLDDPIKKYLPKGYLFCSRCGSYEHHPLIYCDRCGNKYHREKNISWRKLIKRTAKHGSGPINTIRFILTGSLILPFLDVKKKEIYEEASRIYNENK